MLTRLGTITCLSSGGCWPSLWPHPFTLVFHALVFSVLRFLVSPGPAYSHLKTILNCVREQCWFQLLGCGYLSRFVVQPIVCMCSKCPRRTFYPRPRASSSDVPTRTTPSSSFTCHSLVGASFELVSLKCHQTL